MEGCDCLDDGSPSEITRNKYLGFAKSGAAVIWFEAISVCLEGRSNLKQMMITENNLDSFKQLISEIKAISKKESGFEPFIVAQLNHSGRQSLTPMCMYHNSVYEQNRPIKDENIVSDEYLDSLSQAFLKSALLAEKAGFDAIDFKACHGYLLQEALSAFSRPGKYGGSFENRTRLFVDTFKLLKSNLKSTTELWCRLDPCDVVSKPNGFGTDENGNMDLEEPLKFVQILRDSGLRVVNVTLGNPYYNPYVNRPCLKGIIKGAEDPLIGCQRFKDVGKILKDKFKDMFFVGSGLSYYTKDIITKGEEMLDESCFDLIGYGRESLAYPMFYKDYLKGEFNPKKTCCTCGKCAELKKNKYYSGCAVFNEFYKNLYLEMKRGNN